MSQPMPTKGDRPVTDTARHLFNELLTQREQQGIQSYGTTLKTHNGRDPIQDALEEVVDTFQYLTQIGMENADLKLALEILKQKCAVLESDLRYQQRKYDAVCDILRRTEDEAAEARAEATDLYEHHQMLATDHEKLYSAYARAFQHAQWWDNLIELTNSTPVPRSVLTAMAVACGGSNGRG